MNYVFPFGEKVKPVEQADRNAKRIFVLGVYASAVHASWFGPDHKLRVRALAVASEPTIFWRGEGAAEIVSRVNLPDECGYLKAAAANLNGPSGIVLDERFLTPLGTDRDDAWLSDLLPETRLNASQSKAIDREYLPFVQRGIVPEVTIPQVPKRFADSDRIDALVEELRLSNAEYLVTLGDVPLREFVSKFDKRFCRLSALGQTREEYGREHQITIGSKSVKLIPLVHPRQAGRLGSSSKGWGELHDAWVRQRLGAGDVSC